MRKNVVFELVISLVQIHRSWKAALSGPAR